MLSHVCVYEMLLNSEIVLQNAQLQVGRVGLQMWARGEERERERVKVQSSYYLNWNCFTKKLIQELRCLCLLKFIISFNLLLSAMCLWYGKVMRIRFSKLNTPKQLLSSPLFPPSYHQASQYWSLQQTQNYSFSISTFNAKHLCNETETTNKIFISFSIQAPRIAPLPPFIPLTQRTNAENRKIITKCASIDIGKQQWRAKDFRRDQSIPPAPLLHCVFRAIIGEKQV